MSRVLLYSSRDVAAAGYLLKRNSESFLFSSSKLATTYYSALYLGTGSLHVSITII
jgi:hypothetical protein